MEDAVGMECGVKPATHAAMYTAPPAAALLPAEPCPLALSAPSPTHLQLWGAMTCAQRFACAMRRLKGAAERRGKEEQRTRSMAAAGSCPILATAAAISAAGVGFAATTIDAACAAVGCS